MASYDVLLLPGDGIGPEVTCQAVRVLRRVAEKFKHQLKISEGLLGGVAIHRTGALDSVNGEGVMRIVRAACKRGVAGVIVTHDAQLASSDMEFQMQWSQSSGESSYLVDVSMTLPGAGEVGAKTNRKGGAVTPDLEKSAMIGGLLYAMMVKDALLKAAQKGWESGRCVRLDVSPNPAPKDMEPSSTADITAAPRSKMDGGPTGGTVMATLVSGGSGVDPSSTPLPADASFVYTAHQEENNHGTVKLEARSKRGVAKAELTFETRGRASFQIVGGLDDFQVNEAVCDVMKPFQMSGGGFTASFSGGLSGTYSYTGPFDATGGGTYTISLPNGPLQAGSMVGEGSGSVTTPLGVFSNSGTENYVLTPITGCIE